MRKKGVIRHELNKRRGVVRLGRVWLGTARQGQARYGEVGHGRVWQGKARNVNTRAKKEGKTMAEITKFWNHYTMRMLLKGVTPFLQNNPAVMKVKSKGMEPGKPDYDPVVSAEAATYRRADGSLGFPACALRKCLITAGTGIYVTKRKTLASALPEWLGHFPPFEGDELFPFEDEDGQPISRYEIDIRRAIRGKEGVPVARPKIWPWRLRCALKLTLPATNPAAELESGLLQVANKAGQYPGLGDGRPERIKGKGMGLWFGKFEVIEFSIEPLSK